MQIVLVRLVDLPDVALIARTAPEVISAFLPAEEDWFILPMVIGAAERECVLGPDHKGRPFSAGLTKRLLQRVEFR